MSFVQNVKVFNENVNDFIHEIVQEALSAAIIYKAEGVYEFICRTYHCYLRFDPWMPAQLVGKKLAFSAIPPQLENLTVWKCDV